MKQSIYTLSFIIHSVIALFMLSHSFANTIANNGSGITISSGTVISGSSIINNSGILTNDGTVSIIDDLSNMGTISGSGLYFVGGDWMNSGVYTHNSSTVILNGTNQIIGGTNSSIFNNLTINGPGTKTLGNKVELNGVLNFLTGYIVSTNSNLLTINNGGNINGANDASFVKGPVRKIGTSNLNNLTFTFPTGQTDNIYDPVRIKFPTSSTSVTFTVTHFHEVAIPNINNRDAKASQLTFVQNEFWDIHNDVDAGIVGSLGVDVTIHNHKASNTDIGDNPPLYIAHLNGSSWEVPNVNNQLANRDNTLGLNAYAILLPSQKSFSNFTIGLASAALPVTLIKFSVKPTTDKKVLLSWTTTTESINKGFRIERQSSNIGNKFEQIGYLSSKAFAGNSQYELNYSFIDDSPKTENTSYYRLVQEDLDGRTTYSEVRIVKLIDQSISMVFPNPSKGVVNIKRTADGKKMDIQVIDVSGRIIQNVNSITDSNYLLNLNRSGIYYIILIYPETGEQSIQRVMIEK